jgi:flagellar assembly protein FliH
MTSSEATAPSAYAYEQLEAGALVRSRLAGGPVAVFEDEDGDLAERERSEALRSAIADGRAAGLEQARQQAVPILDALRTTLATIEALRDETADRVEREAVELALSLAEQIVAGALDVRPERVVDVVRGALRRLADRQRITIVINPDDVELVSLNLEQLRSELGGIGEATLQADRRIARGGVLVQTAEGTLDAQIETQLERARAVAAEELSR